MSGRNTPPPTAGKYQVFPAHAKAEFEKLKRSITNNGVLVPVVTDQRGVIIDGHHRVQAWNELRADGVKVPDFARSMRYLASNDEGFELAVTLNERRRHLDPKMRKTVARELRKRGWSLRRIAEELEVGSSTVRRDLSGVPDGTPEKIKGLDGKSYASTKRFEVTAKSQREVDKSVAAIAKFDGNVPNRSMSPARLQKKADEYEVRLGVEPDGTSHRGASWSLRCADFRECKLKPNSIDVIVTDPPYTKEGIPLYGDLARFAKRYLKPSGLCLAYAGKFYLPDVMTELGTELEWFWQFTILQNSHGSRLFEKKIIGEYRPVLVFSTGRYKPGSWMHDAIISTSKPEKELHRWQQALDPLKQIIAMVSKLNDLVCDPFAGSATTGIAALSQGRSFLGFEINPKTARIGANRIRQFEAEMKSV
jgi:site-specific DNA-methyltransferase (adenine-specific)